MFKENFIQPNIDAEPEKNEADELVEERDALRSRSSDYFFKNLSGLLEKFSVLDKTADEEISPEYNKMMERIFSETSALEEIKDTVGKDNIIRGLANGVFPTRVEFGKFSELNDELSANSKTGTLKLGTHERKSGRVMVSESAPRKASIWKHLTGQMIPDVIKTLDHELVHFRFNKNTNLSTKISESINNFAYFLTQKFYYGAIPLFRKLDSYFYKHFPISQKTEAINNLFYEKASKFNDYMFDENYRMLKSTSIKSEVSAQKAGKVNKKDEYKTSSIVDTMVNTYGYYKPEDIDVVIATSQAIDRLRALGLNDTEITKVIANAKYDKKTASLSAADKKIEQLAKAKGMEVEDVDTEVDLMRVRSEVNMFKASVIAQEELDNFLEQKK